MDNIAAKPSDNLSDNLSNNLSHNSFDFISLSDFDFHSLNHFDFASRNNFDFSSFKQFHFHSPSHLSSQIQLFFHNTPSHIIHSHAFAFYFANSLLSSQLIDLSSFIFILKHSFSLNSYFYNNLIFKHNLVFIIYLFFILVFQGTCGSLGRTLPFSEKCIRELLRLFYQ